MVEEATSLTMKMDALFHARDMEKLKEMYHPEVESSKPNGDVIRGVEQNFAGFANLVKMFPDMEYRSFNFRTGSTDVSGYGDVCACTFDTVTECHNPASEHMPANAVYKLVKTNIFKDGLLYRVAMEATEAAVICKQGQDETDSKST